MVKCRVCNIELGDKVNMVPFDCPHCGIVYYARRDEKKYWSLKTLKEVHDEEISKSYTRTIVSSSAGTAISGFRRFESGNSPFVFEPSSLKTENTWTCDDPFATVNPSWSDHCIKCGKRKSQIHFQR